MENKILLRILLIGKSETGKTSVMLRYISDIFLSDYVQTIVVDCRSKTNLILGKFAKICVFDSPGNEEFSTLTPAYWHLADIIVFVAAFKDRTSFDYIKKMENTVFKEANSEAMKVVMLNKSDLKEEFCRPDIDYEEEVKIWAEQQSLMFFKCSARFNEENETENTIEKIIEKIINKFVKDKNPENTKETSSSSKKKCKCSIF